MVVRKTVRYTTEWIQIQGFSRFFSICKNIIAQTTRFIIRLHPMWHIELYDLLRIWESELLCIRLKNTLQ